MEKSKKVKFLESHGWETLWSEDNWISPDLLKRWNEKRDFNIDMAGCSTDVAYKYQMAQNHKPTEQEKLDFLNSLTNK